MTISKEEAKQIIYDFKEDLVELYSHDYGYRRYIHIKFSDLKEYIENSEVKKDRN